MAGFLLQQTLNGVSPRIVPGMAAGEGDAAVKNEQASGIIEQRQARGGRLKTAGFLAVKIDIHLHSWNGGRSMP